MTTDRTIFLPGSGIGWQRTGILLVHGLGGTPVELKTLGRRLQEAGATILCCQLAGHCGTAEDLKTTGWQDWYASVEAGLARLEATCDRVAVGGLSMGALDLTGWDEVAYLHSLSAATRKDLRRKLKSRAAVRVEHRERIDGVAAEIEALYDSTRRNSQLRYGDFEELPDGYFRAVADALPGQALFALYWVGERLAAFNLLLLQPDRVIDKFLGMAYPLAREHNLYAVSWMENVRFALRTGRPLLQSGQTAYASKLRYGSRLMPSTNLVRCRNGLLNRIVHAVVPWLAFDRWDPDLGALRKRGVQADPPP